MRNDEDDGQDTIVWHDSILCEDMYKDLKDENMNDFAIEFGSARWVCPLVDEITIQNDPATFKAGNGRSFNMVLNTCEDAKRIDEKFGLTSFNSTYNCMPKTDPDFATFKALM